MTPAKLRRRISPVLLLTVYAATIAAGAVLAATGRLNVLGYVGAVFVAVVAGAEAGRYIGARSRGTGIELLDLVHQYGVASHDGDLRRVVELSCEIAGRLRGDL